MRTAKQARQWVYRDLVAASLRRKAATLAPKDVFKDGREMSDAQLTRCKRECLRLADWLEAKAQRLLTPQERAYRSAPVQSLPTTEEEIAHDR